MVRFGGTLTLTGLTVYVASNFEKVLLGRFWGVDAVGLYGRAYQLINIPTSNLNSAAGEVAFSALSRLQDDPARRKNYFLKGFSLVLAVTLPITIACAFFANDMVFVLLGSKWKDAAPIFRWLAPTILVFAIANPLSWLLLASGRIDRLMKMSLVITPIMILGFIIGLPYGPKGVACAYSVVMTLWLTPLIAWAVHGTEISFCRCCANREPPTDLQRCRWRVSSWGKVSLWSIRVSSASPHSRKHHSSRYVLRAAYVFHRAEVVVPRPLSRIHWILVS